MSQAPETSRDGSSPRPAFWYIVGYAFVLGVVGAVCGLTFIWLTGLSQSWYGEPGQGWFEGRAWWIAAAAAAGLVVGIMRRVLRVPAETPGLVEDLESEHVDVRLAPSLVAVSAVSLLGGASLGPEAALGQMGGGFAGWLSQRRGLNDEDTKSMTLSGMAGAFGGLFSSPLVTMMLVLEVSRPTRSRFQPAFYGSLVASSISLGLYFTIVGSVFLGIYEIPTYGFETWHLLAGVGFGVIAAVLIALTFVVAAAMRRLFAPKWGSAELLKPALGGLLFGIVGFALPLTNFTGSEQLVTVLDNATTLGVGLLIAIVLGKMLAFATSVASGFLGGPIFPILFIGGVAGLIINVMFPEIPVGLAFTCMLAAVPGSMVSAPFTMVLLVALFTQVGALSTAPILIAVGTAYLIIAGLRRSRAEWDAAPPEEHGGQ